jgi:hypothetical protein
MTALLNLEQPTGYRAFRERAVYQKVARLKLRMLLRRTLKTVVAFAFGVALLWVTSAASLFRSDAAHPSVQNTICVEAGRRLTPWFQAEADRKAQIGLGSRDDFNLMLTWFKRAQSQCTSGLTDQATQNLQALENMVAQRAEQHQLEPEDD